jgi:hypothetical protein
MDTIIKSLENLETEIIKHYCRDLYSLFPCLGSKKNLFRAALKQFFEKGGIVTAQPDHSYCLHLEKKPLWVSPGRGINGESLPCSSWEEIIDEILWKSKLDHTVQLAVQLGLELAQTGRRDRDELERYENLIKGKENEEIALLDTEDDEPYKMRLADIPYMGNKSARLAEIVNL